MDKITQVKVFQLQNDTNKWLVENAKDIEVIDIKINTVVSSSPMGAIANSIIMVEFKTDNPKLMFQLPKVIGEKN